MFAMLATYMRKVSNHARRLCGTVFDEMAGVRSANQSGLQFKKIMRWYVMQKRFMHLLLLFWLAVGLGCVTAPDTAPTVKPSGSSVFTQSDELIKKLHINQKELLRIYQNIRLISEGQLFYGSDEQLNTIQKSSLYILLSNRTAHHQWEVLSIMEFIHSDHKKDYISFLIKGLRQAVFNSAYDLNFLNTYYAFIENQDAREHIDRAVALIRANMELYKKLMDVLKSSNSLN
jgi:hypothetical protein